MGNCVMTEVTILIQYAFILFSSESIFLSLKNVKTQYFLPPEGFSPIFGHFFQIFCYLRVLAKLIGYKGVVFSLKIHHFDPSGGTFPPNFSENAEEIPHFGYKGRFLCIKCGFYSSISRFLAKILLKTLQNPIFWL